MSSRAFMCGICDIQPKKYKCPTCLEPYCSAPCFAAHKPSCIKIEIPAPPITREQQIDNLLADADDIGAHIAIERLERLSQNVDVRTAVRDPRLQRLLLTIDSSRDPAKALNEAKQAEGVQFANFLDELLITIGAARRTEGGAIEFTGLAARG